MHATSLYRHFDREGRLLYVGISMNVFARLAQHRRESHWYSQITRVEIEHFDSREEVLAAEGEAIRGENDHPPLFGQSSMTRRPAAITQAEMQRAIRAAKAEGVAELEIRVGADTVMVWRLVPLTQSTAPDAPLVGNRQFSL